MSKYTIYGVEHVYDAFDEYEHPNGLEPLTIEAANVSEAYEKAWRSLQDSVNQSRKGFMSSGSFFTEVIRIMDPFGRCIFQRTNSLLRNFGGQLEDYSRSWQDQSDVPFSSCFLSYNHRDEEFTTLLYDNLTKLRFNCWFAPIDLSSQHLDRALRAAIASTDRLLIVVSRHSLQSDWVAFEVKEVLSKESEHGKRLVFPLFLDSEFEKGYVPWVSEICGRGYGVDFKFWQEAKAYGESFDQLVGDLTRHL